MAAGARALTVMPVGDGVGRHLWIAFFARDGGDEQHTPVVLQDGDAFLVSEHDQAEKVKCHHLTRFSISISECLVIR